MFSPLRKLEVLTTQRHEVHLYNNIKLPTLPEHWLIEFSIVGFDWQGISWVSFTSPDTLEPFAGDAEDWIWTF